MAVAPYPTLASILSHIRVAVNDAIVSIGGQTLTNTAAFTPFYANRGYQMFQQELLSMGYVRLLVEGLILKSLPSVASEDTSLQVKLSWTGYNDGATDYPLVVLPQNLIKPTKLAERLTGPEPNINLFWDMSGPEQGVTRVPSITKDYRNRIWVWNSDSAGNEYIIMPGATGLIDLRVDYASYLADFTGTGDSFPGDQVVPIMRCTDALAWFIAYVFSFARNDPAAISGFALNEARRAAAIIAGSKPPTQTQVVVQ